jgi:hypothetical protein
VAKEMQDDHAPIYFFATDWYNILISGKHNQIKYHHHWDRLYASSGMCSCFALGLYNNQTNKITSAWYLNNYEANL